MTQKHQEFDRDVHDLVAGAALQDSSWMRNPQRLVMLTEADITSKLNIQTIPTFKVFEGTRFFVVTDPTEKPGTASIIIAILLDQELQPLISAKDFHKLLLRDKHRIQSTSEALQVAQQYLLLFGSRYPQYWDKIKTLTTLADIPLKPNEILPGNLYDLIQAPVVETGDKGFIIRLFIWTELGGELKSFEFELSTNGKLTVKETLLAEHVGRAWLPK